MPEEILKAPIAHIGKYATRIAIYPATNVRISSSLFEGASFNVITDYRAFTVPFDTVYKLPEIFEKNYPEDRITIEEELKTEIARTLTIQKDSLALSLAESADVDPNVLAFPPRPFQAANIAFGMARDSFIDSLDMGLGKTYVATYLAESRNAPTLWITKSALMLNLKKEIQKLSGKDVCTFSGRYPTEEDYKVFFSGKFQHYMINYEVIGTCDKEVKNGVEIEFRPWVELFNTMSSLKLIRQIVADEAHSCRNPSALRTQALLRLKADYRIPMTGTLIVNRAQELWTLLNWVDPIRFNSQGSFATTYLDYNGAIKNPKKLQHELAPYIFRRRVQDVLKDLPPLNRITRASSLPSQHKARYELALNNVYISMDGDAMDIQNILVQLNRLREIVADAKVEATIETIQELLEETESKIIVYSNFRNPAIHIAKYFGVDCIHGGVEQGARMDMVEKFQTDENVRVLVLTIKTGQEGLTLTKADTVIFNDLAWTPEDHKQATRRFYGRLNDIHSGTAIYQEIAGTIDEFMNDLLAQKEGEIATIDGITESNRGHSSILEETINWLKGQRKAGWKLIED